MTDGQARIEFPVIIESLSEEDGGGYAALVPDLPGCMSVGETPEEAITNVRDAIAAWISEARRIGRTIPTPSSHLIPMPPEILYAPIKRRADLLSRLEGRKMSDVRCARCKFWDNNVDENSDVGICRRHAPRSSMHKNAVGAGEVLMASPIWPLMHMKEWCGEWEQDEEVDSD